MTIQVSDMLIKYATQKEGVSPVDLVMGEDWGELELGRSMRLSLLRSTLSQHSGGANAKGGRSGGSSRLRVPLSVVQGGPKAIVKVIKNGGTNSARGMRDQMSYLQKDGDAVLERSENFFGHEVEEQGMEDLIEAWGLDRPSNTKSDLSTKSYPFAMAVPSKSFAFTMPREGSLATATPVSMTATVTSFPVAYCQASCV